MHARFLDLLCSPESGRPFEIEAATTDPNGMVKSGVLATSLGERYPIVRAVPRFVAHEHYSENFGYEWRRWPRLQFDAENVGGLMEGHSRHKWEGIVDISGSLEGQTIVEFGCGSGRFLDVVRQKGGVAGGIDLSLAVESARKNFAGDVRVLIVQGDVRRPPFREGVFDGGYAIGALHHLPNPVQGLSQLVRCVRKGGWIACSVYSKRSVYSLPSIARWRRWHSRVAPRLGSLPALMYAVVSAHILWWAFSAMDKFPVARLAARYLEREWFPIAHVPDRRWRVLDTFDAITPSYASTHTGEEVKTWFKEVGCVDVRPTEWGDTSFVGIKA